MLLLQTTSYHTVARVQQVRVLLDTSENKDPPFYKQELRAQCQEMLQLNKDLRAVTKGPVFKALVFWLAVFIAMAYNNFAKLTADSDQPTRWNVFGFLIVVGVMTSLLLVPARVTSECTTLMTDINCRLLLLRDDDPDEQHRVCVRIAPLS